MNRSGIRSQSMDLIELDSEMVTHRIHIPRLQSQISGVHQLMGKTATYFKSVKPKLKPASIYSSNHSSKIETGDNQIRLLSFDQPVNPSIFRKRKTIASQNIPLRAESNIQLPASRESAIPDKFSSQQQSIDSQLEDALKTSKIHIK